MLFVPEFFFLKKKTPNENIQGTSFQLIYIWLWIYFDLYAFISTQPHKSFNELGGHIPKVMEQSETRTGNFKVGD